MAPFLKPCHIVAIGQYKPDWPPAKVKQWVEHRGGHVSFTSKIRDETTHVVVTEKEWKRQGTAVQEALDLNENGRDVYIVSFEWLEACLDKKGKKSETRYLWENLDKRSMKESHQAAKHRPKKAKQPGTVQGLMAQTFLETTEAHITENDRKKTDQQHEQAQQAQKEAEDESRAQFKEHREKMNIPEQSAVFKMGTKRARNDILSDNHHIYVDDTHFAYDVTITKVDWKQNKNERYVLTLQIYESNNEHPTYAFNCQFAGTKLLPRNDIIVAIGSNLPTAFRAFKKVFFEKTSVEWDHRLSHEWERAALGGQGAGGGAIVRAAEVRFEDAPFIYHPPRYGPKGVLPEGQQSDYILLEDTPEPDLRVSGGNDEVSKHSGGSSRHNSQPLSKTVAKEVELLPIEEPGDDPMGYPFESNGNSSAFAFEQSPISGAEGVEINEENPHGGPLPDNSFNADKFPGQYNESYHPLSYGEPFQPNSMLGQATSAVEPGGAAPFDSYAFGNDQLTSLDGGNAGDSFDSYIDSNSFETQATQGVNHTQAADLAGIKLMQMLE